MDETKTDFEQRHQKELSKLSIPRKSFEELGRPALLLPWVSTADEGLERTDKDAEDEKLHWYAVWHQNRDDDDDDDILFFLFFLFYIFPSFLIFFILFNLYNVIN